MNYIILHSARQEDAKTFYFLKDDIESKNEFAEAFEYDPNSPENIRLHRLRGTVDYALNDLLNFCVRNETLSNLNIIPGIVNILASILLFKSIKKNIYFTVFIYSTTTN